MHTTSPLLRFGKAVRTCLAVLTLTGTIAMLAPASPALAAPRRADIALSMVASKTELSTLGGDVTVVDIDVRNAGEMAASDVTVTITLPQVANLTGDSLFFEEWQCDISGRPTWMCVHGSLAAGTTAELLRIPLRMGASSDGDMASVSAMATTSSRELATTNNADQVTMHYVAPEPPDLAISMTAIPSGVVVGGRINLDLDVRNLGGTPAHARVDVPLPDGMGLVTSSGPAGWDCLLGRDPSTGERNWLCNHRGLLDAGQVAETLVMLGILENGTPGQTLLFAATVEPVEGEASTANNTAHDSVNILEPGIIRGTMWHDNDGDGQRDPEDLTQDFTSDHRVWLIPQVPQDGDQDVEVVMNQDGTYTAALKPGPYIVQMRVRSNIVDDFTTPDVGDDATDSDIVAVQRDFFVGVDAGTSAVIDVTAGSDTAMDAGVRLFTNPTDH